MPNDPLKCEHVNFRSQVEVARITHDVTGKVIAYQTAITVECVDCGLPFWFPGTGVGVSYTEPVTAPDGFELRAPIVPANRPLQNDPSLVMVKIHGTDAMKGHRR